MSTVSPLSDALKTGAQNRDAEQGRRTGAQDRAQNRDRHRLLEQTVPVPYDGVGAENDTLGQLRKGSIGSAFLILDG